MTKMFSYINKFNIRMLILFAALCFVAPVFIRFEYFQLVSLFLCVSLILIIYLNKNIEKKDINYVLAVCLTAFSIRFVIIIIMSLFPTLEISSDAGTYEAGARNIINEWNSGNLIFKGSKTHFFYYVYNAVAYELFGFHSTVVKLFNSFLGILAGVNIYIFTNKLFSVPTAKKATFLTLFFPSLVYWQTMNLKEALIVFLVSAIIKNMLNLWSRPNIKTLSICFVYISFLIVTRNYAGIIFGFFVLVYFLGISKYSLKWKTVVVLVTLLLIGFITYKSGMGVLGWNIIKRFDLEYIDNMRKVNYKGSAEVLLNVSMDTPLGLIKFFPVALVYFIFSPFPWHISSINLISLSAIENIIWDILFVLFFFKGVKLFYKKDKYFCVLLFMILSVFIFIYTITMGNMGLAFRMRSQLLPIFFIFISIGIDTIYLKWKSRLNIHGNYRNK
ncbi:MAG: glycosyltransferase family 39 protein [Clostridia bacterium]|nr:glycosyltransferase family 39 protein [Clostridia bacterium]